MKGEQAKMNITLNEIEDILDRAGLKHKRSAGNIISQCPMHADYNSGLNCTIRDTGFCYCFSHNCTNGKDKGFWLDDVFVELKEKNKEEWKKQVEKIKPIVRQPKENKENSEASPKVDLLKLWKTLEPLTENIPGKNIPFEFLNQLGWRKFPMWGEINGVKYPEGWFIPYFGKTGKTLPYGQIRHDKNASWQNSEKVRRFSFIKGVTPIWHGLESLDRCKKYVCFTEGSSDRAVLEYAGIPCLGLPAGKSADKVQRLMAWCVANNKVAVYCGDNDEVGDYLLDQMDSFGMIYRVARPPLEYKDYGDMFDAVGIEPIKQRLNVYIGDYKVNRKYSKIQQPNNGLYGNAEMPVIQTETPILAQLATNATTNTTSTTNHAKNGLKMRIIDTPWGQMEVEDE